MNETLLGTQLEKQGWRQGAIIKSEDTLEIISALGIKTPHPESLVFIVASQSCDIANNQLTLDPYVELSIGCVIETLDGNRQFNKNPRVLHTTIEYFDETTVSIQKFVELKACEKATIPKEQLLHFTPCVDSALKQIQLNAYVDWLAARYKRPAHPTKFNELLNINKLKKKLKPVDNVLSGIYVEITPDKEIADDEKYSVNLLGLYPVEYNGELEAATKVLGHFETMMREAGMDVTTALMREDKISVALHKKFKRFYFDDLSYKNQSQLPPEV